MAVSEPTFAELFATCERSAPHLEMRDGYMRSDPRTIDRGVIVRRARIVSEPVSEYIRFEYDITFTNIVAGEQVRWLARRKATDIALPGDDF